jgi:hypothetical protein
MSLSGPAYAPQVTSSSTSDSCNVCEKPATKCKCNKPTDACAKCGGDSNQCGCLSTSVTMVAAPTGRCPAPPDMSKYVLKSSVPPCPPMPDMSKYMLKTECPPLPDMSKYVLKSSVPKCPPCVAGCSKPCKIGECPPCPRPRCPDVKPCPRQVCPACPPCPRPKCPEPNVKCKPVYDYDSHKDAGMVRPVLASLSAFNI